MAALGVSVSAARAAIAFARRNNGSRSRTVSAKPPSRVSVVPRATAMPGLPLSGLKDLGNCVEAKQFDRAMLEELFVVADAMSEVKPGSNESTMLQGYLMSTLFYEPSTRTRLSFEGAMGRLGGGILSTESAGEYSSAAKGETLEDTIRTVEGYSDIIVLRHFEKGAARRAANVIDGPVINAGDGPGEHPTQALLDTYTIYKELGRLDNIKVGLVGDLANGRTVRSLASMLTNFENVEFVFIAPDVVKMGQDIKDELTRKGYKWTESDDLLAVASEVDVLYQTRIQKERFADKNEYEACRGIYNVDQRVMDVLPAKVRDAVTKPDHTVLPKLVTVCPYIAMYKTDTFVCLSQVGGHAPPPKARRNHARRGRRPQGRVLQASEKRPVHQNGAPESATQGVTLGRECDLFSFSFSLGSNSSHTISSIRCASGVILPGISTCRCASDAEAVRLLVLKPQLGLVLKERENSFNPKTFMVVRVVYACYRRERGVACTRCLY
jgi:aspartate carbamoyltransferase catalytic subunit